MNHAEKQSILFDQVEELHSICELIHINNVKLIALLIEKETRKAHYICFENDVICDFCALCELPENIADYLKGFILKNRLIVNFVEFPEYYEQIIFQ